MSAISKLPPKAPGFVAGSAAALALMLFWAILTFWVPDHWSFGIVEAGVLAMAAAWAIRFSIRPYSLTGDWVLIPLAGTVVIGTVQLLTGSTVNRWETWNAVLRWSVYVAAFLLASQICSWAIISRPFRRALLYFGFGLSLLAVLQFFTSPGKVFWIFQTEYQEGVLGPFVNRDHYAAFIELVLPMALFEAMSDRRKTLVSAAMAGAMVASVIAGGSRAGSILVIVESAAVIFLTPRRNFASAGRISGMLAGLLVVCILGCTAVVGWTKLWQRFQDPDPYGGRRELLTSAVAMARARPWSGFGLGNFENAYPGYSVFDTGDVVDHAHNDWAEWAADGGVPFLACMLAIAIWSMLRARRCVWGLGVMTMFLHSLVDSPMQKPTLALWVFVLLGAMSVRKLAPGERTKP